MKVNIAAVGLAHPFEVGYEDAPALLNQTAGALAEAGADCRNTGVVMHDLDTVRAAAEAIRGQDPDVLLICVATWSEDHHLLDLLSYCDKPVIIRAYPARETGSLCCAHQIGAVFTDIGKKYEFVYGDPGDAGCARKTLRIASAYALARRMERVRVGAIGGRVKGMTEIAYDEFAIKQKLGPRIVNLDETEMTHAVEAMSDQQAEALLAEIQDRLVNCRVASAHPYMLESVKYYHALSRLCSEYELEALAVKCYTTYMGKVCLGYSLLAGEGIVGACEGDVNSAVSMKLLYELSGIPVNNTDLLYLNEEENSILFAHCGSSGFSIADGEIELGPVRLAESGVCCRFLVRTGTVTAVNICGHGDGLRMSVMTGEAIPCGMEFPGNPVKIRFEKDIGCINEEIMRSGIGHHWMVGYGDFREELMYFCRYKGIRLYEL